MAAKLVEEKVHKLSGRYAEIRSSKHTKPFNFQINDDQLGYQRKRSKKILVNIRLIGCAT